MGSVERTPCGSCGRINCDCLSMPPGVQFTGGTEWQPVYVVDEEGTMEPRIRIFDAYEAERHTYVTVKLTPFEVKEVVKALKERRRYVRVAARRGGESDVRQKLDAIEAVLTDLQSLL